jgi:hypothetical protein
MGHWAETGQDRSSLGRLKSCSVQTHGGLQGQHNREHNGLLFNSKLKV